MSLVGDRWSTLCIGIIGISTLVAVAACQVSQRSLTPCSQRYALMASATPVDDGGNVVDSLRSAFGVEGAWGLDRNLSLAEPSSTSDRLAWRITFPAGTSAPSDGGTGGAGFSTRPPGWHPSDRACLSYRLRFPADFDFVRGGKLPGLYGGSPPSGGDKVTGDNGFSLRFMWREGGAGELYAYVLEPAARGDYGSSLGRGQWDFDKGRWQRLELEVVLNRVGQDDGVLRVWLDGKAVLEHRQVVFRTRDDLLLDGIMFSTFFGGHGPAWRSPRDQFIDFSDFRLLGPAKAMGGVQP